MTSQEFAAAVGTALPKGYTARQWGFTPKTPHMPVQLILEVAYPSGKMTYCNVSDWAWESFVDVIVEAILQNEVRVA